jgi:hypothetical protein
MPEVKNQGFCYNDCSRMRRQVSKESTSSERVAGRGRTVVYKRDEMTVKIADVLMKVRRCSSVPVPSEITVVIPHVEIRRQFDKYGKLTGEELILDSITIVDSPIHQPLGSNPQPLSMPRTTWRYLPDSGG